MALKARELREKLSGGDLRSLANSDALLSEIQDQSDFDALIELITCDDPVVVMRAADMAEKISQAEPQYLQKHKKELFSILKKASQKELKWHLALFLPRLKLSETETIQLWNLLLAWAKDRKESRIVRVHSLEGLYSLLKHYPGLETEFSAVLIELEEENIPSLSARIRIIRKKLKAL